MSIWSCPSFNSNSDSEVVRVCDISCREGIQFVINGGRDPATGVPSNLAFLEILCEFSGKLMKQDKKVVLV